MILNSLAFLSKTLSVSCARYDDKTLDHHRSGPCLALQYVENLVDPTGSNRCYWGFFKTAFANTIFNDTSYLTSNISSGLGKVYFRQVELKAMGQTRLLIAHLIIYWDDHIKNLRLWLTFTTSAWFAFCLCGLKLGYHYFGFCQHCGHFCLDHWPTIPRPLSKLNVPVSKISNS